MYDGIEEVAWISRKADFKSISWVEKVAKKNRVVLFRNAEYKASYCKNVKVDAFQLVKEISKNATVVYLPRYAEEKEELEDFSNVLIPPKPALAVQLIPYVDAVIGSGGTICRESALMGVPTINFHFWDAPARYLHRKEFPIKHVTSLDKIVKMTKKILKNVEKHRVNTKCMLENLESPVPIAANFLEKCLGKRT